MEEEEDVEEVDVGDLEGEEVVVVEEGVVEDLGEEVVDVGEVFWYKIWF